AIAERMQQHIGGLFQMLLSDVKQTLGGEDLCLGGGLCFNSNLNSAAARSRAFDRTFIPANPGNAGPALRAALIVSGIARSPHQPRSLSPFLGPEYEDGEIKATLDNCKLSYDYCREDQIIERVVTRLGKGQLVGWFQGRMEWGPRALGNRSILASP